MCEDASKICQVFPNLKTLHLHYLDCDEQDWIDLMGGLKYLQTIHLLISFEYFHEISTRLAIKRLRTLCQSRNIELIIQKNNTRKMVNGLVIVD